MKKKIILFLIIFVLIILSLFTCNSGPNFKDFTKSFNDFIKEVEAKKKPNWDALDDSLQNYISDAARIASEISNQREKTGFEKTIDELQNKYETLKQQQASHEPLTINFFLDNSFSIDGYINKSINLNKFIGAIGDVLNGCEIIPNSSLSINVINNQTIKIEKSVSYFKGIITPQGLSEYGDRNKSDLNNVFSGALNQVTNNSVSIMVSDGIYSMVNNGQSSLTQLVRSSGDTRTAFIRRLQNEPNIETVVVKLNADFIGDYFSEYKRKYVSFNYNERPYYIWLFGTTKNINKILDVINIDNAEGYENKAHYYLINNRETKYSVTNIGKIGNFRTESGIMLKDEITDVDISDRPNSKGLFGFTVAVDLCNLPLSKSYITNSLNYHVEGFEVDSITEISPDFVNKDRSLKDICKKENFHPTHLIYIHTDKLRFGKINIELLNKDFPWIKSSSNIDDTNPDSNTTFGFEYLMGGVSKAYSQLNGKKNYINIEIEIKN